ncbi:MAG: SGNH/GDSL hydrolase family protein [Anaerolineae bacterium]|nr:SGNH/GDSL hydrolase family protein [Anaerolineae bacterium]
MSASIVLIGDSIRMGYEPFVREMLRGQVGVWGPKENGGTSQNVLAHLWEWVIERGPDVVHINAGLHDLKRGFGAAENAIPLTAYRANVEAILRRILAETDARVIWATITPVNEVWHHANKPFDRFEADVTAYNQAAIEVCRALGVPVNDLYRIIIDAGRDQLLLPDGVHFSEEGYRLLARAVVSVIEGRLS